MFSNDIPFIVKYNCSEQLLQYVLLFCKILPVTFRKLCYAGRFFHAFVLSAHKLVVATIETINQPQFLEFDDMLQYKKKTYQKKATQQQN